MVIHAMDMKVPPLRFFSYIALVMPFVFVALWIASALVDGEWRFGYNSLSEMGISDDTVGAFLFNFACIISGISGIVFGFGIFAYGKSVIRLGGALFTISHLFLSLVGVFNLNFGDVHYFVASTFGLVLGISYVFLSLKDWGHWLYLIVDIVFITVCVVFTVDTPFTVWEPALIISAMVWIFIIGVKMYREEESMFGDTPRLWKDH